MKKTTIREKIAYLECLENLINHATYELNCWSKYDSDNNVYLDEPHSDDEYTIARFKAWKQLINELENKV